MDADLEFAGEASITLCTRIDLRQTQFLKMWEEKYGDGAPVTASDAASDAELAGGDDLLMADDGPAVTGGADVSARSLSTRSDSSSRSAGAAPAGGRDASVDSEGEEAAVAAALLAASDLEESEEGGGGGKESGGSGTSSGGGGGAKASASASAGKKKSLMDRVRGMMKNMAASLNQVSQGEGNCWTWI